MACLNIIAVTIFQLKYNFVETPRKFIIAELSIRKLGSLSMLIIMRLIDSIMQLHSLSLKRLIVKVIFALI